MCSDLIKTRQIRFDTSKDFGPRQMEVSQSAERERERETDNYIEIYNMI